ncbi:MAG: helix-turn-helix transcriptional regulator [bacterium]
MAATPQDFYKAAMAISSDERQFFVTMGERIAQLRKERNITQTQLAEVLGVSQQTVHAYEAGSRRIPVSALPAVAQMLSVPLEVLFGSQQQQPVGRKRGPVPQWQHQMEAIAKLPRARQKFVSEVLQSVLAQDAARA